MKRWQILLVAVTIVLSFLTSACGGQQAKQSGAGEGPIKIGFVGPLSGSAAAFGVGGKQGVQLAEEQINKAGGIKGRQIKVIYYDDKADPRESVEAVRRLVEADKVVAIIGGFTSSTVLAAQEVSGKAGIPQMTPIAGDPKITRLNNPFVMRNAVRAYELGAALAQIALDTLGHKDLAVINQSDDWGNSLRDAFIEKAKEKGANIVATESYPAGTKEFKALLLKIAEKKPQSLAVLGFYTDGGLIAKQAREIGLNVQLLADNTKTAKGYLDIAGQAAEGTIIAANYVPGAFGGQAAEEFTKEFQAKYNEPPNVYAAHAYDALKLFALAIEKAGTDPKAIKDAVLAIKDYPGAAGPTTFLPNGDVQKPVVIARITNGKLVMVGTINVPYK